MLSAPSRPRRWRERRREGIPPSVKSGSAWRDFQLADVIAQQKDSGKPYLEFLRVPSLSCGIYTVPAGAKDLQSPHDED